VVVKVVWVSRRPLTPEHIEILKKAFGKDIAIRQVDRALTVEGVLEMVEKHGEDAKYVTVLPPHLMKALVDTGVEVYKFTVEREYIPEVGKFIAIPTGLERVLEVKYITEKVV